MEGTIYLLDSMITNGLYLNHKDWINPKFIGIIFWRSGQVKPHFGTPAKDGLCGLFYLALHWAAIYSAVKLHFLLFYVHNLSSHTGFMSEWLPTTRCMKVKLLHKKEIYCVELIFSLFAKKGLFLRTMQLFEKVFLSFLSFWWF